MKYVLRIIASALYFALIGCVSLAPMMGDCFPTGQHVCPTDAQRNHAFLVIWAVGLLIYFPVGWFLIRHENRRRASGRNGRKADANGGSNPSMEPIDGREFLVVYDYGMGGAWAVAKASSEAEIEEAFPELRVVAETPAWMTPDRETKIRRESSFVLANPHTYPEWLNLVLRSR